MVAFLFLPQEFDYRSTFSKPLSILVIILIIAIAVLAFPPLVDWLIGTYPRLWPLPSLSAHWSIWDRWMQFGSFCLELALALLVGGSVFGEWIASKSKDLLQAAQDKFEFAAARQVGEVGQELVDRVAALEETFRSARLWNLPLISWRLYHESNAIARLLLKNVPRTNARFLAAKMSVAFPGGLYGLLAFVTFWLLAFLKVVAVYHQALAPLP